MIKPDSISRVGRVLFVSTAAYLLANSCVVLESEPNNGQAVEDEVRGDCGGFRLNDSYPTPTHVARAIQDEGGESSAQVIARGDYRVYDHDGTILKGNYPEWARVVMENVEQGPCVGAGGTFSPYVGEQDNSLGEAPAADRLATLALPDYAEIVGAVTSTAALALVNR
jgi:hypothetical protein